MAGISTFGQLSDVKLQPTGRALQISTMLAIYAETCGWTLAQGSRPHRRAQGDTALFGDARYLDEAIADFAEEYADQNEQDYATFERAVRQGRLSAEVTQ